MNYRRTLLAASAVAAFGGLANAQLPYAQSWQDNHNSGSLDAAFTGPGLFGPISGTLNFASQGDSIRRCFAVDAGQGGKASSGLMTNTFFRVYQAYSPSSLDVDIGIVSIQTSTVDGVTGDACFSPIFSAFQPGTQTTAIAAAALIGPVGVPGNPFPAVWNISFWWLAPGIVQSPNQLGTDSGAISLPGGAPLLATVIYEVQGPLNGGINNNQYYVGSTSESPGFSASAPGGLADGDPALASALFGVDAVTSNAISHTRLTAEAGGTVFAATNFNITGNQPGSFELGNSLAFNQPALHAIKDGNDGTGAPDWNVSGFDGAGNPIGVSVVDLRVLDVQAGGETNPAASAFKPGLAFNRGWVVWSATPGGLMSQKPTTWCTYAGFASNGDPLLGSQFTTRGGSQTIPVCFDTLFVQMLSFASLSLCTEYTDAEDFALDGGVTTTLFQGGLFNPYTRGVSDVGGLGAAPLLPAPDPLLAGATLGIGHVGLQVDLLGTPPGLLTLSEFANGLQLNFQ
ncbi:MAG TPA: hypothetical protein VJP77_03110 [Planctomycetota bacterium]|nr:hypothetical protein [Planctomycetota bacterium]